MSNPRIHRVHFTLGEKGSKAVRSTNGHELSLTSVARVLALLRGLPPNRSEPRSPDIVSLSAFVLYYAKTMEETDPFSDVWWG